MDTGIHLQFDERDIDHLNRAMLRMVRESEIDNEQLVRHTAFAVARSGRAATKLSKKRRDIIGNPDAERGKAQYLIRVRHQEHPDTFIPTNSRSDPRRLLRMRGAAKNSWAGVLKSLGAIADTVGGRHGTGYGYAVRRGDKWHPVIEITNLTSYLLIVHPDIAHTAAEKGARALEKRLDRRKRTLGAAWR